MGTSVHTVEGVENRFIQCDVSISGIDGWSHVDHGVLKITRKALSL